MRDASLLRLPRFVCRSVIPLALGLLCTLAVVHPVQAQTWSHHGPEGGNIYALAIDPGNPSNVYTGTYGGGIYRSVDKGVTWIASSTGLSSLYITSLSADPGTADTVYAGTEGGGVCKTVNGGYNWIPKNTGLLRSDLSTPTVFAVAAGGAGIVYAGTDVGVFKSNDWAGSWSPVNTGIPSSARVNALTVVPGTPNTVYAGTDGQGIYKTTDGGERWSSTGPTTLVVLALAVFSSDPSTVLAGTNAGLFRTIDGGATWSPVTAGLAGVGMVTALAIPIMRPDMAFVGTNVGVFKTIDRGATWTAANAGVPATQVPALAVAPDPGTLVIAGTDGQGLFASTDSGVSWSAANARLLATQALALAYAPSGVLHAGTGGGGVHRSVDGGLHWQPSNAGLTSLWVYAVAVAPSNSNIVYAGTDAGVFMSTDGGLNWTLASTGLPGDPINALAVHPTDFTILYAGTQSHGVYKSSDGGTTWSPVNTGLTHMEVRTLAIHPATPATLYVGLYVGGIFKSTNSGLSWNPANTGLPGDPALVGPGELYVHALAIHPTTPATLYAGIYGGVYKSIDDGATWSAAKTGLGSMYVYALKINPSSPSTLYAATDQGVFITTDSGATWTARIAGLTTLEIVALAVDGPADRLYAGTAGAGAFVLLPGPATPQVALSLNSPALRTGQPLTVTVNVTPGHVAVTAHLYLALYLPDGSLLYIQPGGGVSASPQAYAANWTVQTTTAAVFSYTFGGGEPAGTYRAVGVLADSTTGLFIDNLTEAPFTFTPKAATDPVVYPAVARAFLRSGSPLTASLAVTAGTAPATGDLYVALQFPDGSLNFLQPGGGMTSSTQPYASNWSVVNFSDALLTYTFNAGDPVGTFKLLAGFTAPGSMTFATPIYSTPFQFAP